MEEKNKINVEEFILHQLDWSLERKSRLEMKAVGYLTAVALIITVLGDFIVEIKGFEICSLYKWVCFGGYIVLFILGGIILYLCTKMLLPREIGYFKPENLIENYLNQVVVDKDVILACKGFIETNYKAINALEKDNKKVFKLIKILVGGFIFAGITFFIGLGVKK